MEVNVILILSLQNPVEVTSKVMTSVDIMRATNMETWYKV